MGKLYVVGYGSGTVGGMTAECRECLDRADVIVGYSGYIDPLRDIYPGKRFVDTPMKRETERCKAALDLSLEYDNVCVVCSGDGGVYGMASLIYELAGPEHEVSVIPGVTAACAGGAMLGAPIGHDFAVVSLSDLLTPWELIEKRLRAAGEADFVICLYNPGSHKRSDYLKKACDILLESRPPETVCGIARNAGREEASSQALTLGELRETPVDMFTTVFIGSSATRNIGGKMVTPRGYRDV